MVVLNIFCAQPVLVKFQVITTITDMGNPLQYISVLPSSSCAHKYLLTTEKRARCSRLCMCVIVYLCIYLFYIWLPSYLFIYLDKFILFFYQICSMNFVWQDGNWTMNWQRCRRKQHTVPDFMSRENKDKVFPLQARCGPEGGYSSTTAALEGDEWSAAHPACTLPPGKTRYPLYRRLGGPQDRSGRAESLFPTGVRSRTVQPVVSRYTN